MDTAGTGAKPVVIGLTGGMGCGKSTAGRMLERRGFRRIDTDEVVRRLLDGDPETAEALREYFGEGIFRPQGGVDRAALAKRVFASQTALGALESILHPRVRTIWEDALRKEPDACWCVEIPLLFEKKLEKHFDFTLCLSASEAVCLARLAAKGFTKDDAHARMARQLPLDEKIRRADYVLSNNGSLEFLETQTGLLTAGLQGTPKNSPRADTQP